MTRYERGFINKCAEYGYDPHAVVEFAMQKRAVNLGSIGGKLGKILSVASRKTGRATKGLLDKIPGRMGRAISGKQLSAAQQKLLGAGVLGLGGLAGAKGLSAAQMDVGQD